MRFTRRPGIALLGAALAWSPSIGAAKIACVGDSITEGYGLENASAESYPAQLAKLLGSAHTVKNFGVSGTTLLENGDSPYVSTSQYPASDAFAPDVVVIMLGTNDSKPQNWSKKSQFAPDYAALIAHYRDLGALVYVATPPPVYPPGAFSIPPDIVENEVVPAVRTVASDAGAPLIEIFTALSGKSDWFPDTVHPNVDGQAAIADTVQAALDMHGFGGATAVAGAGGMGQGGRASGGASGAGEGGALAGSPAGGRGGVSANAGASNAAGTAGTLAGGGSSEAGRAGNATAGAGTMGGTGGTSAAAGRAAGGATSGAGTGGASAGAPDAGGSAGSTASSSGASNGSSCGCRAAGSEPSARGACTALLALAAVALRRRSRRRHRTPQRGLE